MRNLILRRLDRSMLDGFRKHAVGCFENIQPASLQDFHDEFVHTLATALGLIREYDPRHYRRVVAQTDWIVDLPLWRGKYAAGFKPYLRATLLDFEYDETRADRLSHAAYYAGRFVHEAVRFTGEGFLTRRRTVPKLNESAERKRIGRWQRWMPYGQV